MLNPDQKREIAKLLIGYETACENVLYKNGNFDEEARKCNEYADLLYQEATEDEASVERIWAH